MFKKKFKIRVQHYTGQYYIVEYAHYWLIPNYNALYCWFTNSLSKNLLVVNEAEKLANRLNSIENINRWNEKQKAQEKQYYIDKAKDEKQNIPYKVKYFKK
jgi:hypothetical protein